VIQGARKKKGATPESSGKGGTEMVEHTERDYSDSSQALLLHEQLVGKRLYTNAQIRFLVVAAIAGGSVLAKRFLGIHDLDVLSLLLLAGLLGLFNIGVFFVARRHRDLVREVRNYRWLNGAMHFTIAADFIFLTATLRLVGGAKSPFLCFYILHVILAAALLSPRSAWVHTAFGCSLLGGLVLGQWSGWVHVHQPAGIVSGDEPLDGRFALMVFGVQGLLMGLSVFLLTGLTRLLRMGERQLRDSNQKLERLSKTQRDFLHIALHDLKAPVNAATMLVHGLTVASDVPLPEAHQQMVTRILKRLSEVSDFLHDLGVLAALDSADFDKLTRNIDVGELLKTVADENKDLIRMHRHSLRVDVPPDLPPVRGVERLIHEAVVNLITNASKYTPDGGQIILRARGGGHVVRIEVEDNGIGIAREDQKRLFQEFARIRRKVSTLPEVTGSGLGLSIVRRVVEAHKGRVGVVSELGKGSTFYIELPAVLEGEDAVAT